MKRDIVEIYNHLFDKTLDGALYEKVLDYHYFKFAQFYNVIKDLDMNSIDSLLYNADDKNNLELIINFNTEDIVEEFINGLDKCPPELTMTVSKISESNTSFNILIKSEGEEVKIYANRFNSFI